MMLEAGTSTSVSGEAQRAHGGGPGALWPRIFLKALVLWLALAFISTTGAAQTQESTPGPDSSHQRYDRLAPVDWPLPKNTGYKVRALIGAALKDGQPISVYFILIKNKKKKIVLLRSHGEKAGDAVSLGSNTTRKKLTKPLLGWANGAGLKASLKKKEALKVLAGFLLGEVKINHSSLSLLDRDQPPPGEFFGEPPAKLKDANALAAWLIKRTEFLCHFYYQPKLLEAARHDKHNRLVLSLEQASSELNKAREQSNEFQRSLVETKEQVEAARHTSSKIALRRAASSPKGISALVSLALVILLPWILMGMRALRARGRKRKQEKETGKDLTPPQTKHQMLMDELGRALSRLAERDSQFFNREALVSTLIKAIEAPPEDKRESEELFFALLLASAPHHREDEVTHILRGWVESNRNKLDPQSSNQLDLTNLLKKLAALAEETPEEPAPPSVWKSLDLQRLNEDMRQIGLAYCDDPAQAVDQLCNHCVSLNTLAESVIGPLGTKDAETMMRELNRQLAELSRALPSQAEFPIAGYLNRAEAALKDKAEDMEFLTRQLTNLLNADQTQPDFSAKPKLEAQVEEAISQRRNDDEILDGIARMAPGLDPARITSQLAPLLNWLGRGLVDESGTPEELHNRLIHLCRQAAGVSGLPADFPAQAMESVDKAFTSLKAELKKLKSDSEEAMNFAAWFSENQPLAESGLAGAREIILDHQSAMELFRRERWQHWYAKDLAGYAAKTLDTIEKASQVVRRLKRNGQAALSETQEPEQLLASIEQAGSEAEKVPLLEQKIQSLDKSLSTSREALKLLTGSLGYSNKEPVNYQVLRTETSSAHFRLRLGIQTALDSWQEAVRQADSSQASGFISALSLPQVRQGLKELQADLEGLPGLRLWQSKLMDCYSSLWLRNLWRAEALLGAYLWNQPGLGMLHDVLAMAGAAMRIALRDFNGQVIPFKLLTRPGAGVENEPMFNRELIELKPAREVVRERISGRRLGFCVDVSSFPLKAPGLDLPGKVVLVSQGEWLAYDD